MNVVPILIEPGGTLNMVFTDRFDLRRIGRISIRRGSHVEPTINGDWIADLSPVGGPTLGPFTKRTDAIAAELDWLQSNWLTREQS